MQAPLRLILCVVYCHTVAAGLNYLYPGWFSEVVREVGRLAEMHRLESQLEARLETLKDCQEAKRQVVTELLAQRLTLREAGARFQELNAEQGDNFWWKHYRECYAGDSDAERHCREVIRLTTYVLMDQSSIEASAVGARLQEELDTDFDTSHSGGGGF